MTTQIPEPLYKDIISNTINLCTDVVLRYKDQFLFIRRTEEPCKDVFWPIGGRIHKGETAEQAARRKIKEEIGLDFKGHLEPIGYYEDKYDKNSFGLDIEYCTMSIVFFGVIKEWKDITLDETSSGWGLFNEFPERFKVILIGKNRG
jgi:ADP-ribose pyrophosphatase YjhB (NUDIX family)